MRTVIYTLTVIATCSLYALIAEETKTETDASLQTRRDKLRIGAQKICPVSGNKLGPDAVKVRIGKQTMFLCCKECSRGKVDPIHWKTVHANFARAQGICPVMKQKLPAKPKYTIVNGQLFYVCCPPCTAKIEDEPEVYLAKLDQLHAAALSTIAVAGKAKSESNDE